MAITNKETGKIIGCEPGSLTYLHEKAHILYSKMDLGIRNEFYEESFLIVTVLSLVLNIFYNNMYTRCVCLAGAILFLCFYYYEEVWCWVYAWRNKK